MLFLHQKYVTNAHFLRIKSRMTHKEFKDEALRVRPQLLQTARRYLSSDDAEDVVQDVLLRLWQMVDDLRLPMDALARVLTRNLCVSHLRQQSHALDSGVQPITGDAPLTEDNGLDASDDTIGRMMAVIEGLPSLQQTILRLRHMEGMEMRDIAALIGTTEVAIRKALSRARQRVRTQYLTQYGE